MRASRSQQSPLNLKFFDVKFLKLDEGRSPARSRSPRNLQSYRQAFQQSHQTDTTPQLQFQLDSLTRAVASQLQQLQSLTKSQKKLPDRQSCYRQRISELRNHTEQIHREIITLYQKEHQENTDKVKKVCHIELSKAPSGKNEPQLIRENVLTSFYDNLRKDCNTDYLRKIDEVKNRIAGCNVLKKFEEELIGRNKRVPMFLKEMHS